MTQFSDGLHDDSHSKSSWLPILADLTLVCPLFLVVLLYGEWLLAWWILGHMPIPSLDDPKYIDGSSWMHPVVALALLVSVPAFFAALLLNALNSAINPTGWRRGVVRIAAFLLFWAGTPTLLRLDPGGVVYWWLD